MHVVLPKMGSPNNIERLSDLFKQPQMTSEVTEVNYLEVDEELCIHDVLPKKGSFHYLVISPYVIAIHFRKLKISSKFRISK